jgi:hypothetical protein
MPKQKPKGRTPTPDKNRVVLQARVHRETMKKINARAPDVGGKGRAVDEAFGVKEEQP